MEPGQYGEEDASPRNMTQIPIEGLLDEFGVFVTDFYEDLNEVSERICYQEFGAFQLEDIQRLRTVIGKRFYAAPYADENSGAKSYNLVLESAASHFSGAQQSQPGSQGGQRGVLPPSRCHPKRNTSRPPAASGSSRPEKVCCPFVIRAEAGLIGDGGAVLCSTGHPCGLPLSAFLWRFHHDRPPAFWQAWGRHAFSFLPLRANFW